jgi:hypothetical protein
MSQTVVTGATGWLAVSVRIGCSEWTDNMGLDPPRASTRIDYLIGVRAQTRVYLPIRAIDDFSRNVLISALFWTYR